MPEMSKLAKQELTEKIQILISQGHSKKDIARQLGIHVHTVTKYLDEAINKREKLLSGRKLLARKQLDSLLEAKKELDDIKKEYWKIYKKTESNSTKFDLLKNMVDRIDKELKILTKLLEPFIREDMNLEDFVPANKVKKMMETIADIIEKYVPANLKIRAIESMASIKIGESDE